MLGLTSQFLDLNKNLATAVSLEICGFELEQLRNEKCRILVVMFGNIYI